MPLNFIWKPQNFPLPTQTFNRLNFGLELGGNDDSITAVTPGRIKINEVSGKGIGTGIAEAANPRLIATFHGNFHRDPRSKIKNPITFEILNLPIDSKSPYDGQVRGFDPECMLGVDAFVLTFLNREFVIFLPFMVDTIREGNFLEFQASAEIGPINGSTALRCNSPIKPVPIRRKRIVETTSSQSGKAMQYTGELVGNVIAHHVNYLVQGATKPSSAQWPNQPLSRIIPLPLSGPNAIPFQNYTNGNMNIVLIINKLINQTIPDANFLRKNVKGVKDGDAEQRQVHARFVRELRASLINIFTDAGFVGAHVFFEGENAALQQVNIFKAAFKDNITHWILRNNNRPLATQFWNFFIIGDDGTTIPQEAKALAEMLEYQFTIIRGGLEYMLPFPSPIGSGNKMIRGPIKIKYGEFQFITGLENKKKYPSMNELNRIVNLTAGQLAIVIAHEIGHSLGLMHDILVRHNINFVY